MYLYLQSFRRKNLHKPLRVHLPLRHQDFTAGFQNLITPCLLVVVGQVGQEEVKDQRAWQMNHYFLSRGP